MAIPTTGDPTPIARYIDPYKVPETDHCYAFAFSRMYPRYQQEYAEMLRRNADITFQKWLESVVPALRPEDV